MTIRQYLALMSLAAALCWGGLLVVVSGIDPMSGGLMALAMFYASLGLAVAGTLAVIGLLLRARFRPDVHAHLHVADSFRQSLVLTALFLVALFLQSRSQLGKPQAVLLVGLAAVVESFLAAFRAKPRQ